MTKDDLQKLYKSKILPENEHPYHFQEIKSFDFQIEAYNPMCGDKYWLFFEQHGNQISNVFFMDLDVHYQKPPSRYFVKAWKECPTRTPSN